MLMSLENLVVLVDMMVCLLELWQNECKNLVVEDSVLILFGKLVGSYLDVLVKEVFIMVKVVSVMNRVDFKSFLGWVVFLEVGF